MTALNEIGEVRVQFHVYSDSHEQMTPALEAFKSTTAEFGLPGIKLFLTDNPVGDKRYFMDMLPSLKVQQKLFDDRCDSDNSDPQPCSQSTYDYSAIRVRVISQKDEVNQVLDAMSQDMKESKIGLDAEWNVEVNSRGHQTGSSNIKTIQIAYRSMSDDMVQVLIFKTDKWKNMPNRLESLLSSNSTCIAGVKVSGDLNKIGRDFASDALTKFDQKSRTNVYKLGRYARERDVVQNAA